jgi:hypothetical protein
VNSRTNLLGRRVVDSADEMAELVAHGFSCDTSSRVLEVYRTGTSGASIVHIISGLDFESARHNAG